MLKLFSAFAIALLRSFSRSSHAAFGVCFRIAIARSTGLFLMRSRTISTLRGEIRVYFRTAFASILYSPFS